MPIRCICYGYMLHYAICFIWLHSFESSGTISQFSRISWRLFARNSRTFRRNKPGFSGFFWYCWLSSLYQADELSSTFRIFIWWILVLQISSTISFLPLDCAFCLDTNRFSSPRVRESSSTPNDTKWVNALGGSRFRFSMWNIVVNSKRRWIYRKFISNLWNDSIRKWSTGKWLLCSLLNAFSSRNFYE